MNNILKTTLLATLLLETNIYADSFKIYALLLNMDYEETGRNGEYLNSEKSTYTDIAGLELEYDFEFNYGHGGADKSALELNFSYVRGQSDYDGFLQSGGVITSAYKTITDEEIYEQRIRWRETTSGKIYDASVFTSLGYRYWVRDSSADIHGYREEYSWGYGDIGLQFMLHEGDWHVGIDGAYQRAFAPQMKAFLNGGLNFNLGTTSGYVFSVPLRYDINKQTSFEISYEYDYWDISASNVVNGSYEPDSLTKNETIKLGLIIKW